MVSNDELKSLYQSLRPYPSESTVSECLAELIGRRADALAASNLLIEVMQEHSDRGGPNYNECDKVQCSWCDQANALIDKARGTSLGEGVVPK